MGDKVIQILTSTVEALAVLASGEPNGNTEESYFSREEILPISIVANLKKVQNLIKDIVEVDTHGLRVRKRSASLASVAAASSSSLNLGQQQRSSGSALNFTFDDNSEITDLANRLKISNNNLAIKLNILSQRINFLEKTFRSRPGLRVGVLGSSLSNPQGHLQTSSTPRNVQSSGGVPAAPPTDDELQSGELSKN